MRHRGVRLIGALPVLVAIAVAMPAAPAHAWSKACRTGRVVSDGVGGRVLSTVEYGRVRVSYCTSSAARPRAIRVPATLREVTQVVYFESFDEQRSTVALLGTTQGPRGRGAVIIDIQHRPATVTAQVGPSVLRGRRVVQFAVQPDGVPAAALLSSGTIVLLKGTTARVLGRATGQIARGSLVLDLDSELVTWRTHRAALRSVLLYPPPACDAPGAEVTATTQVRVFASRLWGRRLYACLLATGQVQELTYGPREPGTTCTGCYYNPIDEQRVTVTGGSVVYHWSVSTDGDGEDLTDVLDVARGRITQFSDGTIHVLAAGGAVAFVEDLASHSYKATKGERDCAAGLSDGQLAWALVAVDAAGRRVLDCRLDPRPSGTRSTPYGITDLQADGQTISWSSLGTPRTATLR